MNVCKSKLKTMDIDGYKWTYYEKGMYAFQKEFPATKTKIDDTTWKIKDRYWIEVKCLESELFDGSLEWLIKEGRTR